MSVAVSAGESIGDSPGGARIRTARLRQANLRDSDRNYAVAMHLLPLGLFLFGFGLGCWLPTLVMWQCRKKESVFNDDHGREITNFLISFGLWHVILAVTVVGLFLWPVLWVLGGINAVRGAIAAGRGEYFRYPMTIRFLS